MARGRPRSARQPGGGGRGAGPPPPGKSRRHKLSSQQWLERQKRDPFVSRAKAEGYRSRAAYKLTELDDRFHLLKPGRTVVDLGAAPGSWSEVAAKRVGATEGAGVVLAVDVAGLDAIHGVRALVLDVEDEDAPAALHAALPGGADAVLSDLAAPSTGHRATDALRAERLAASAFAIAAEVLHPGGDFVAKVMRTGTEANLLDALRRSFTSVRHVKPAASRSDSAEIYVVCKGFRPAEGEPGAGAINPAGAVA